MRPWQIIVTPRARHDLDRLAPGVRQRVVEALELLATKRQGDVAKLHGVIDEYRLRVGGWRVRFRFDTPAQTIVVLQVLPRGRAYHR